jgi:flavin-dependent dehydrogenase
MGRESFDCVIVGARCAGAPLATHLARGGMRVCLLDAAKLPSDQPFSTHAIQPPGMDLLDELGVGARIRAVTPAARTSRLTVGPSNLDMRLPQGREMYCPRRSTLDPLLAEAAVAAGAALRDETSVLDVLREGDRVVGVRARHGGRTGEVRAPIVVGADGRNSTIARRVEAAEYLGFDAARAGYWAYWPVTPEFDALPFQTHICIRGELACFAFRTDGDQVIAGALASPRIAASWKGDVERHVRAGLEQSDGARSLLLGGNAPATPFVGLLKARGFFRVPVGPGWALVGDAGMHLDATPGYGITDALRDAKALAAAILDGREAAFEVYWRERDVLSIPLHANGLAMGALDYDNPFNELLLDRLNSSPSIAAVLPDVMDRKVSPFEMVPAWRVLAWSAAAMLRGRTEIWAPLMDSVKQGTWVRQEVARRVALLKEAERRLVAAEGSGAGAKGTAAPARRGS